MNHQRSIFVWTQEVIALSIEPMRMESLQLHMTYNPGNHFLMQLKLGSTSECFFSLLQQRSHKNTDILLEQPGMCSLSIKHVISIEHVIARLRISFY